MGFSRVWTAAWAGVWAGAAVAVLAGRAMGQPAGEQPAATSPELVKTPEELKVEAARAEKYAPTRDYRRERLELIVSMTGGRGSNTENGWGLYRSAVAAMAGMSRYALDGSPVMERWEKEKAGESISSDEILWAAGGLRPNLPEWVAEEGVRVVEQFHRTGLPRMLDQLAEETRYFPPIDAAEPAIAILLPGLGEARTTARFNGGRMVIALKKGDEKESVRAARHNYAVSRATASEAVAISHLVSTAIDTLTMTRVIEATLREPLSPTLCRAMLDLSTEYPGPNYELSMRGEGLFGLDTIHWVYTKGRIGDLVSLSGSSDGESKVKAAASRALWVTREAALEMADDYFVAASKLFDPDPAVAAKAQAAVDAVQKRSETEPMFRVSYQAFATLMPAMSAIARSERQARGLRGAYRMMLAAELYHHEHGDYPENAEGLKGILGELPRDWFAKDGSALRYRRVQPKQDRLGRSYLLYSVGVDGVDNGGVDDPESQYRAVSGKNPEGFDLVFNWDVEHAPSIPPNR